MIPEWAHKIWAFLKWWMNHIFNFLFGSLTPKKLFSPKEILDLVKGIWILVFAFTLYTIHNIGWQSTNLRYLFYSSIAFFAANIWKWYDTGHWVPEYKQQREGRLLKNVKKKLNEEKVI